MGKFSRIKLILKCNRLENEVQTLNETMKSETWKKILKLLDVPEEVERLKRENKRLKKIIKERGWKKMTKKLAHTLIFISLVLIITGLIAQIIVDNRDNQLIINDYKKQIEAKDELIEQQGRTIIKLKSENEALWDNYYMNVSEYDGEYYE